jgi:hypothetical protein
VRHGPPAVIVRDAAIRREMAVLGTECRPNTSEWLPQRRRAELVQLAPGLPRVLFTSVLVYAEDVKLAARPAREWALDGCLVGIVVTYADHLKRPFRIQRDLVAGSHRSTVVTSGGGSAGVPSSRSSLKVTVIQSSCPGPDGPASHGDS